MEKNAEVQILKNNIGKKVSFDKLEDKFKLWYTIERVGRKHIFVNVGYRQQEYRIDLRTVIINGFIIK